MIRVFASFALFAVFASLVSLCQFPVQEKKKPE
jgi:hypothetical protein